MRQAGRYLPEYRRLRAGCEDFLAFCTTPDLACEATLQPLRRFPLDAAIIFADILLIPAALGLSVSFVAGKGPLLKPAVDQISVKELARPAARPIESHAYLAPVCETIAKVRCRLIPETDLIGFCGAPFTLAAYMIHGQSIGDGRLLRRYAVTNRQDLLELEFLLARFCAEFLIAQVRAGADVVMLFDSWAGMASAFDFEKLIIEPTRLLIQTFKQACPDTPLIAFPKNCGFWLPFYQEALRPDGLSLDAYTDPQTVLPALPPNQVVQGHFDPMLLFAAPAILRARTRQMKRMFAGRPWIANLGHGVDKDTSPEHVAIFLETIKRDARGQKE